MQNRVERFSDKMGMVKLEDLQKITKKLGSWAHSLQIRKLKVKSVTFTY